MQPQTSRNTLQKFLFKSNAVALRGSIRKPYYQDLGEHAAVSTLAGATGNITAASRGFVLGEEISYDSASAEISAGREGSVCHTLVTSTVVNLRIGKRFAVDQVVCRLRSVYDVGSYPEGKTPRILPSGSSITNLRIDGVVQKIALPPAFNFNERQQDEFFAGKQDADPGYAPGVIPDSLRVDGFGTIYFAEWVWVHPGEKFRQHLVMLRLALGSDSGAEIDVGTDDTDGSGWPPTSP